MPNKAYWAVIKSLEKYPENWTRNKYRIINNTTSIWTANGWPFLDIRDRDLLCWSGGFFSIINPFNLYLAYKSSGIYTMPNLKENMND